MFEDAYRLTYQIDEIEELSDDVFSLYSLLEERINSEFKYNRKDVKALNEEAIKLKERVQILINLTKNYREGEKDHE